MLVYIVLPPKLTVHSTHRSAAVEELQSRENLLIKPAANRKMIEQTRRDRKESSCTRMCVHSESGGVGVCDEKRNAL